MLEGFTRGEKTIMAKKRLYKDHALTSLEKKRRHTDKAASIDKELDEAIANIDWNRRTQAETSLVAFIEAYLMGVLFEVKPSAKMREVMKAMF